MSCFVGLSFGRMLFFCVVRNWSYFFGFVKINGVIEN